MPIIKFISAIIFFLITSCKDTSTDCLYRYNFIGHVVDSMNLPIAGVEIKFSSTTEPGAYATTDVNGDFSLYIPSYVSRQSQFIIFHKTGLLDVNSLPFSSSEISSSCNNRVDITRNATMTP
jgi:hypothetical protein